MPATDRRHRLRLRLTAHGVSSYPPGTTFGPRTLRDFELLVIIAGDCVLECDGVRHPAPPGTVILTRPGMRDAYRWDPERQARHAFVHFDLVDDAGELPPCAQWPLLRHLPPDDVIRPLLRHLDWLLGKRPAGWEEMAQSAMRHCLLAFINGSLELAADEPIGHHPAIERTLTYVRQQWRDDRLRPIPLAELARAARLSRAQLVRLFRSEFDLGPVEALRRLRLHRAASMLSRTSLPVGDIAERCGFASAFHFSRTFTAAYRLSPRVFRRRMAQGMDMPLTRLSRVWQLSKRILYEEIPTA